MNFWRADNLRECIKYSLTEFSKCLRDGVLKHFFIQKFNLLSVKLTRAAQTELLQLFDVIIQSDISILKECRSLCNIWSEFLQVCHNRPRTHVLLNTKRKYFLINDDCAMEFTNKIDAIVQICKNFPSFKIDPITLSLAKLSCKTPLKNLSLRKHLLEKHIYLVKQTRNKGNKSMYQLCRTINNDTSSYDIATNKLWCAMFLFMNRSISETLYYVNKVISIIPPFAMYMADENHASNDAKKLYVNTFMDSGVPLTQRARTAWLFHLKIAHDVAHMVSLAIQIELFFQKYFVLVSLSPFTCAHYLKFLCYQDMHQYNNRDRALQELIDIVNDVDKKRHGLLHTSLNITGHCLLLSGRGDQAHHMFLRSYQITLPSPLHAYNSAIWYLQNCF